MKKIILFIATLFLLISCSNNNYIKTGFSQSEKQELILNIDFTKLNIFVSEPSYTNEYPSSLLALNMNEDTYYFELFFIFDNQNKKWLIFDLKEKG